MTKVKRLLVAVAAMAFVPVIALAQQKAPPADPARIAAAKDLFKAMGSEAQMDVATTTMYQGLSQMFRSKVPADKHKEIDAALASVVDKLKARKGELLDMVAPIYAERFTTQELNEISGFFKTPIGQKLVKEQPGMIQRSMQAGMSWGQKLGQEVEAEMRQELKKRGIDL